MSVSLTHVQAALQNHLTSSGSGPLTLNVLHKTDALVQQLQSLNQGKPLNVEVLKSLPNGRAEVLTNGLKLDVKASLPLTKGEVLQLKLEQHGSALRFVQPLGDGATVSKAPATTGQQTGQQIGQQQHGNLQGGQNAGTVHSSSLNSASLNSSLGTTTNLQSSRQLSGQNASQLAQQNSTLQNSAGNISQGSATYSNQGGQINNAPQTNTAFQSNNSLNSAGLSSGASNGVLNTSNQSTTLNQTQTQTQAQHQAAVSAQTVKPGQVQAQITASALIGVVADTLPNLAKKISPRSQVHSQLQGHEKSAGRVSSQGTPSLGGANVSQSQALAQDVSAKYKNTSSLAIEEVQEVQQRSLAKPMELNLELPIQGMEKPVLVNLQIGPEQEESETGEQRDGHGVKFSLETNETGAVHASVGLFGQDVRVTLWAERAEFAESLEQYRNALDDRLVANGLGVHSLHIRRGAPPEFFIRSEEHVDAQI